MKLSTDIGPVIDEAARDMLQAHAERMTREAKLLRKLPLGPEHADGVFFPPHAFELRSLDQLRREVFGPVLHVIRYSADKLDAVCEAINATGYGLTLGIHSRIEDTARLVRERVRAGNIYVNRNQIGAGGRRAAFRRRGALRHRAQGGRAALSAAVSRSSAATPSTLPRPAATWR